MNSEAAATTVPELRRLWKPHKERLAAIQSDHPTAVRVHRAFSWLGLTETLDAESQADLVLIHQWIAFNALYGQWDENQREPVADRQSWQSFLAKVVKLDASQQLVTVLTDHKRLVMAILGNAYLNRCFWSDGDAADGGLQDPKRHERGRFKAQSWYVERRWLLVLEQLLERVYLLRCQLVHGAATFNSRLNRDAMKHCTTMLRHLLPALLSVLIEHGADEDWGPLCYPPLESMNRGR